ncbi:MAG TPA: squalene synthase HpnC [Rubrivivax sp.]|nr:squalene synthase HpnC [Burkholderiales bacterium]HNT39707.1 squalene synthase HpnC [Rubrivivax sp.]
MGVDHYENFPVASLLCPPALRPAVAAIYWFARTADDLADEGHAAAADRVAELRAYRSELQALLEGRARSGRWSEVFEPLARAHEQHALPASLLHDLLDAFEQDVRNPPYPDRDALRAYCARSANPIGRLLLHLYGIGRDEDLERSDAICTALQLINFWQDLGRDQARGRNYLPAADLARHRIPPVDAEPLRDGPALRACVRELCEWAAALMRRGAPLALRLPGRAGWELRLVVQGGLRILEKIERLRYGTLHARPALGRRDVPLLLWRALRMGRSRAA